MDETTVNVPCGNWRRNGLERVFVEQLQVFPAWTEIPGTDNYGGLLCFGESRGDKSGRI